MKSDFEELLNIFSDDKEEMEGRIEKIFEKSRSFFDEFEYVIEHGSEREKELVRKQMSILKEKISRENAKIRESIGLSKEEVETMVNDPKNFTSDQWKVVEQMKTTINKELSGGKSRKKRLKNNSGKKARVVGKSSWLKS